MRALKLILILIPALVLSGCGSKEPARVEPKSSEAPVAVTTALVQRTPVPSAYEATGTVQARVSGAVSAKLMGYATEVRAQIGDQVKEGQTLVLIDSREQDASIREADAGREEIRSGIPEAESAIVAAKAQFDLARVTLERFQDLWNKRSVTRQEYDEAAARLATAQASLDMARARRAQLDSKLARAEQAVRSAGIQRTFATVTAPFSGLILTKSVEPGTLVMPGVPLFTMERAGSFRLEVNVEESRLGDAHVGKVVAVTIDDRKLRGKVGEIVPAVDAASRTAIVKIDLPALPNLHSGTFGRASFAEGERQALTIPKTALIEHGSLQSVFVADQGAGRSRLVTLGSVVGDRIEVLSGLTDGEAVVSPVPVGLRDGSRLEVRR